MMKEKERRKRREEKKEWNVIVGHIE